MRAQSATVMLLHYEPGTHEEITRWHEEIHRPEMHASIPNIYHSDDWVAPAEYMALRPSTDVPRQGGQYLCLYWSQGTAEDLSEGVRKYSEESRARNSEHPYQEITWRDRMVVGSGQVRDGLNITVDTVPLLHNSGLLLAISEGVNAAQRAAYEQEQVTKMLASGIFSGHYDLHSAGANEQGVYADIYFIERGDPIEQYPSIQKLQDGWHASGPGHTILTALYRPIIPGQYDRFYK
jgi:hypothetical protein